MGGYFLFLGLLSLSVSLFSLFCWSLPFPSLCLVTHRLCSSSFHLVSLFLVARLFVNPLHLFIHFSLKSLLPSFIPSFFSCSFMYFIFLFPVIFSSLLSLSILPPFLSLKPCPSLPPFPTFLLPPLPRHRPYLSLPLKPCPSLLSSCLPPFLLSPSLPPFFRFPPSLPPFLLPPSPPTLSQEPRRPRVGKREVKMWVYPRTLF